MREHLYKAKRIDNGEWVEGVPLVTKISGVYIIFTELKSKGGKGKIVVNDKLNQYEVDPETVCQFIQEVNNQRIFENDIVKAYKHGDLETQPFIYPIEYRNGTYWFGNWTWLEFLNVMRFVEVVGNLNNPRK